MTDKIREAFEKWAINNVFNLQRAGERYFFTSTHDAWCGYQAALSSLEQVGKFQQEYMGGPVIWYQVNIDQEGEPLYRIAAPKGE